MTRHFVDLTGKRYDRLVVKSLVHAGPGERRWLCACDCGGTRIVATEKLRMDKRCKTLGCMECRLERAAVGGITHGGCRGTVSPLWSVHASMRARCNNPNVPGYPYYGGKGIVVCQEWQDFASFRAWAEANGYRRGLSIDRIDPSKSYCPENCEWVSRSENTRRMAVRPRRSRKHQVA